VQQDVLLLFPRVAVERVPVDEHDRLAGSMVLVVDLNVCVVFLTDGQSGHATPFHCRRNYRDADRRQVLFIGAVVLPSKRTLDVGINAGTDGGGPTRAPIGSPVRRALRDARPHWGTTCRTSFRGEGGGNCFAG